MPDRSSSWAPRPRPPWVAELNAVGSASGDLRALVPLDEGSLLDAARRATGLEDFGDDAWVEPFRLLLDDLDGPAQLHLVGRTMARADLVRTLTNRLRLTAAHRADPGLAERPVTAPVVVTGMGRSGTTILHELLARDPGLRTPATWELLRPCPEPGLDAAADRARRQAAGDAEWRFWEQVTPEYASMHDNRGDAPNECLLITAHEFASDYWGGGNWTPRYGRWLQTADLRPAYEAHRRFLQVLQAGEPDGRTWALKAPSHLTALPALFAAYADARVVVLHRDPLRVLSSIVDLLDTLCWQRSDVTHHEEFVRRMALGYPMAWDGLMDQRDRGLVPEDRIVDLRYADLVADPTGTVEALYGRLGLEWTPAAAAGIVDHLAARPQHHRGRHEHDVAALGLDLDEVRARFAAYQARYDVPSET